MSVIGLPISKQQYNIYARDIKQFAEEHARRVREMQDNVAKLSQAQVDQCVLDARNHTLSKESRASGGFHAYAWLRTCNPFDHTDRTFYQNLGSLVSAIFLHPDWLYRYGLFFMPGPSREIYDNLAKLHPPSGLLYAKYCMAMRVSELEGFDVAQLTNWLL